MARGARKVRDKALLRLIGKYLRAGILVGEPIEPTATGGPQGSPLSPLLSNILLDDLDKELATTRASVRTLLPRFSDCRKSSGPGARVKARITRFLAPHLKLEINEQKSMVGPIKACTFLGFTFQGSRIYWSSEAFQDFRQPVAQADGTKLGRLEGLPDSSTQRVYPGLDAVLWPVTVLPSATRT